MLKLGVGALAIVLAGAANAAGWRNLRAHGTQRATAEQREYTQTDYLSEVDGLGYKELVTLTDPTGEKAAAYRAGYYDSRRWSGRAGQSGNPQSANPLWTDNTERSTELVLYRGWTDLTGSGQR